MSIAVLIVAAGRGTRAANGHGLPKQYAHIGGASVLRHTVEAFATHRAIDTIAVVIHGDDRDLYETAIGTVGNKLQPPVIGGATRQDSVRLGLEALASGGHSAVLIHDAARPFVSERVITNVIDALRSSPAVIAAMQLTDTLKHADIGNTVVRTVERNGLWRAQTPQGFHFERILNAHRRAATEHASGMTDDSAIAEWAGIPVVLVEGSAGNTKITTREDLEMADARLTASKASETRTATGFDIHRFADGDSVWLGGVRIPHSQRLDGHSDADVVLHALTDALLGTIGDGDIGQHFPPSDPQWKGAASILFLKDAARRVAERGGRIVNVDMTILAESPKIGPHRGEMQQVIGAALNLPSDRIGIKATTMEGLGAVGRREGIAAMATASVELPRGSD